MQVDGPAHGLEHLPGPHRQALEAGVVADQDTGVDPLTRPGHHANDGNVPADPYRPQALLDGAGAADLHDEVRPDPAGGLPHGARPLGRGPVVDQVVGAQQTGPLELVVRRGGNQGPQARGVGELQAEDRHPARALQDHRIAGLQAGVLEQAPPGGEAGAGQGRDLLVGEEVGDLRDPLLAEHLQLCPGARDGTAQGTGQLFHRRPARGPVLEEQGRDPVAGLDPRDALAHRLDHAAAIGKGGDAPGHGPPPAIDPAHHQQVAVVQRNGAHPHQDLAVARRRRGPLHHLDPVDAPRLGNLNCAHGCAPISKNLSGHSPPRAT